MALGGLPCETEKWNRVYWMGHILKLSGILITDHHQREMMVFELLTVLSEEIHDCHREI